MTTNVKIAIIIVIKFTVKCRTKMERTEEKIKWKNNTQKRNAWRDGEKKAEMKDEITMVV